MASPFFCECIRKIIHVAGYWNIAVFLVVGYYLQAPKVAFLLLTLVLIIFLELEYVRVEHPLFKVPHHFNIFRKKEQKHFGGHVYMTVSAIICFAAFPLPIASAALSMMIMGDLAAALVGKKWGTHTFIFSNKTWEGTIAGFIANIAAGYFFLNGLPHALFFLLSMAAVASLVEVFTQKLDDNLTIPVFAGMWGQMLFLFI